MIWLPWELVVHGRRAAAPGTQQATAAAATVTMPAKRILIMLPCLTRSLVPGRGPLQASL